MIHRLGKLLGEGRVEEEDLLRLAEDLRRLRGVLMDHDPKQFLGELYRDSRECRVSLVDSIDQRAFQHGADEKEWVLMRLYAGAGTLLCAERWVQLEFDRQQKALWELSHLELQQQARRLRIRNSSRNADVFGFSSFYYGPEWLASVSHWMESRADTIARIDSLMVGIERQLEASRAMTVENP